MEWLLKSIEIYDGNWHYHYICPLGAILWAVSFLAFLAIATAGIILGAPKTIFLLIGLFIVMIISHCIGKDTPEQKREEDEWNDYRLLKERTEDE